MSLDFGSGIGKVVNVVFLGLPGMLFKTPKAPENYQRIGDLAKQTAKEGEPRPIVYGRARPIGGNIMHSGTPVIKKVPVEGGSSGGKGGKSDPPTQYQDKVYRTYAIRICEGPVTAVMRVWRNNKLVYDARGNAWGAKNNPIFLKSFRLYLGAWDQMPDATLEGQWGAGAVPGYRGTCYMVAIKEDLTELGGAIPQFIFEVDRAEGSYLTSKPYRAETTEHLRSETATSEIAVRDVVINMEPPIDHVATSASVTEVTLRDSSLKTKEYMAVEAATTVIKLSELAYVEEFAAVEPDVTEIKFSITYNDQEPEGLAPEPDITEIQIT